MGWIQPAWLKGHLNLCLDVRWCGRPPAGARRRRSGISHLVMPSLTLSPAQNETHGACPKHSCHTLVAVPEVITNRHYKKGNERANEAVERGERARAAPSEVAYQVQTHPTVI